MATRKGGGRVAPPSNHPTFDLTMPYTASVDRMARVLAPQDIPRAAVLRAGELEATGSYPSQQAASWGLTRETGKAAVALFAYEWLLEQGIVVENGEGIAHLAQHRFEFPDQTTVRVFDYTGEQLEENLLRDLRKIFHKRPPVSVIRLVDSLRTDIDEANVIHLVASMRFDGWLKEFPAVLGPAGVVIDGRHRLAAAKILGYEPVTVTMEITEAETLLKRVLQADIRKWDDANLAAYVKRFSEAGVSAAMIEDVFNIPARQRAIIEEQHNMKRPVGRPRKESARAAAAAIKEAEPGISSRALATKVEQETGEKISKNFGLLVAAQKPTARRVFGQPETGSGGAETGDETTAVADTQTTNGDGGLWLLSRVEKKPRSMIDKVWVVNDDTRPLRTALFANRITIACSIVD